MRYRRVIVDAAMSAVDTAPDRPTRNTIPPTSRRASVRMAWVNQDHHVLPRTACISIVLAASGIIVDK
jgi:hypothetical protein